MVQPLFRRRIHRGLSSISSCETVGAGLRLAAPGGQERCKVRSFRVEARASGDRLGCSPRGHGTVTGADPEVLSRCAGASADVGAWNRP
jgi:hypothetical protein